MANAYLRARIEERASLSDAATAVLDKIATENRDSANDAEQKQLEAWEARCKALDAEIAALETSARGAQNFRATAARVDELDEAAERRAAIVRERPAAPGAPVSVGRQFVESDAFRNYRGRGTMDPVEFSGFLENRAAITTGDLDIPPVLWEGPSGYTTTTPLLDAIGREVVSSGSVEYITWGTADPKAAVVAEGELKPEAVITPTTTPISLQTYAHWKGITRQALEDYSRIQSIVEGKLRGGLASALEDAASAVIQAAAWPAVSGPDLATGIRLGVGQVQAAGYAPNAILLNPADYAQLDIDASAAGNNGPVSYGTFWGLRPIAVGALPAGTAYVGDFKEAVTWFDRNTASVFMTDSHADMFIRNILVILAEQRSAFAATELNAAAEVTVAPETVAATRSTSK